MSIPFTKLGIRPELVQVLKKAGIAVATPVQAEAIPVILSGKDTMAQAQTGTGKTLAFILPIVQKINIQSQSTQALIITPTRELALQITEELNKLAPIVGAKVLAAYGGQDVEAQIRKLKVPPHIVVATPGRLLDHLRRETLKLTSIQFLVLDEADQMLEMGFSAEVDDILEQTPQHKQTLLFSATLSDSVRSLAKQILRQPEDIQIKAKLPTVEATKQIAVETTDRAKQQTLVKIIEQYRPFLAVVFCRTKIRAKKLTEALLAQGLNVDELHGDLSQAKREQVMKRFREAKIQILVATDVAARGLDVEGVTHVFNYDFPSDKDTYIHRIGRTGRAGQTGVAVSLVTPRDHQALQHLERGIKMNLSRKAKEEFLGDQGQANGYDGPLLESTSSRRSRTGGKGEDRKDPYGASSGRRGSGRSQRTQRGRKGTASQPSKQDGRASSGRSRDQRLNSSRGQSARVSGKQTSGRQSRRGR